MKAEDIPLLAQELMDQCGLKGWEFNTDRAKRRAGCCKFNKKLITLSIYYIVYNLDNPDDIRDTILHEIAHALTGPEAGHGPAWKQTCREIGARPERCYDVDIITMPKGQCSATCPNCGMLFNRHKMPRRPTYHVSCGETLGKLRYTRS